VSGKLHAQATIIPGKGTEEDGGGGPGLICRQAIFLVSAGNQTLIP
jgi:hypothetical protein